MKKLFKDIIGYVVLASVLWVAVPILVPWRFTMLTGLSMAPTINDGAIGVLQVAMFDRAHIANGTIITYIVDLHINGTLRDGSGVVDLSQPFNIEHRIIGSGPGYYTTKGDNNSEADPWPVYYDNVTGIYVGTIWNR